MYVHVYTCAECVALATTVSATSHQRDVVGVVRDVKIERTVVGFIRLRSTDWNLHTEPRVCCCCFGTGVCWEIHTHTIARAYACMSCDCN